MDTFTGIDTNVVLPDTEEGKLTIKCYQDMNVVEFSLDGKVVFSGDWEDNFRDIVSEMKDAFDKK